MGKNRLYTYKVVRYVRETYEVEILSEKKPTRDEIESKAVDPSAVAVTRVTIKPISGL